MSLTMSRGLADASRWAGVASATSDYIEHWLVSNKDSRPAPPRGIFNAAERFLNRVLEGIALEHRQAAQTPVPTMAGISNLTIAVDVFAAMPGTQLHKLEDLEKTVQSYLECLRAIPKNKPRKTISPERVESLRDFFRELQRQGNVAHHAAITESEFPLP